MLLGIHREDPIEREAILLGTIEGGGGPGFGGREVVVERDHDLAALLQLEFVLRAEPKARG